MPKAKYDYIYKELRQAIESQKLPTGGLVPSEYTLIARYGCSRNTVRRAIAQLGEEGYVQSIHGKGVFVIYHPRPNSLFSIGGIESMKEAAIRNGKKLETEVVGFKELTVDAELAEQSGFPAGEEVYYVIRVRRLDGEALILDHNYFLKSVVTGLTPEIAKDSVYQYLEEKLGETIVTTRRRYTAESEEELDSKYLDLRGFNCVTVVSSKTFNKEGVMFEFTVSRHVPSKFVFYETAQRKKEL